MTPLFRKYSAFFLTLLFGLAILYMARDFIPAIFAAIVLALITYPLYSFFLRKTQREIVSASLVIAIVLILLVIPLTTIAGLMLNQVSKFDLNEDKIAQYEQAIVDLTGKEVIISDLVNTAETYIKSEARQVLPEIVSITSTFLLFMFIMFFVLFYLLIQKDFFLRQLKAILPFSKKNSELLVNQSGDVVKAVLVGQVLTAIIQGTLGMVSFLIVGIEGAVFWGIIMILLSIIPVVGAFLVWVPAGLFLLLEGNIWQGIFVLAWGALIVSQVDNLVRPKLVNKFADIHPLETFIGVFVGLAQFGLIGVVLGPLLISQFKLLMKVFRQEYNTKKE